MPKTFPIQGGDMLKGVPWRLMHPHEEQARVNHGGQSLHRLAERQGLSPCEAVAVIEGRRWEKMESRAAEYWLIKRIAQLGE